MSDQPSTIFRETKGIWTTIKDSLKTKEPFDREIDFQRKNLRRRLLNLLLVHPYAKESENAETRLWMETSYCIIAAYKQTLTRIDRPPQQQSRNSGPVEHRKLLQRFRQFLAEEEKFWAQFVVRYHRSFTLDETRSVLVTLGILSETEDPAEEISPANGRNHFQFPPSTSFAPTSPADRESRLTIMSKALVCLGDIARYREQYNESGGRSRVGPDDGGGRKRPKRGGAPIPDLPRPRNFEKARTCYQQAKLLTPEDGNPSHQLAIIASYERDSFMSLVHYYRCLCVKHPYETASNNVDHLLGRALEQWKATGKTEIPPDIASVPKVHIEEFKKKVVVLHAFWWLGHASKNSFAVILKQALDIFNEFYYMVSERFLPEDSIIQLVTLAQGALWRMRMRQESSSTSNSKSKSHSEHSSPRRTESSSSSTSLPPRVIEARIYTHLLSLYRALLEVGIDKLKEPPPMDSDQDLAQRLIVEFRRTLPAMRIAGKWLRANYNYVMSDPESQGNGEAKAKGAVETSTGIIRPTSVETIDFWSKYAEFLRALSRAFPMERLPDLSFALSEDIEMRGFKPLKGYMDSKRENFTRADDDVPHKESEVHPNEVQLMRIKDILDDAKALVQMENSPLAIYGNQFVLRGVESQVQPIPTMPTTLLTGTELEDDAMTELTSNTDDVIREAFEHLDKKEIEEDDDVDEIVWDPKPSSPPDPSPVLPQRMANIQLNTPRSIVAPIAPPEKPTTSPSQPHLPLFSSPSQAPASVASPAQYHPLFSSPGQAPVATAPAPPRVDKITAEDLFKGFMGAADFTAARTDPIIPRLLPGNNIWSASQDEQALRYITGPQSKHTLSRQHNFSASQDHSSEQSSIWSYSAGQNPQHHSTGLAATSAVRPAYSVTSNPSHHPVSSAAVDARLSPSTLSRKLEIAQTGLVPSNNVPYINQLDQANMLPNYSYQPPPYEAAPDGLYNAFGTANLNLHPHTHARHLSFHDPSVPSIWGNSG
jgi:protein SMG7